MFGSTFPAMPLTGIGMITPYDFALDRELWRWTPESITLHVTRLPFATPEVTVEMVTALSDVAELTAATKELTTVQPSVVVYACNSGSFVGGASGEQGIRDAICQAGAPAAVTTSGALLDALAYLHITNVAVATPYTRDITEYLEDFLQQDGRTVVGVGDLGMRGEIWKLDYAAVADLVRSTDRPAAEAIVISCTNVPSYDLIGPLEIELGKPILSANQVTMWAALRTLRTHAIGPGQRLIDGRLMTDDLPQ